MYEIATNDGVIGYSETPGYCYKLPSGSPQIIGDIETKRGILPTGIVFRGTVYNLPEHNDFDGAETAIASECDLAEILTEQAEAENKTEAQATYTAMMTDTLILANEGEEGDGNV